MGAKSDAETFTTVEQGVYPVPDIPIKDLLSAIPTHCFERSPLKGMVYVIWDLFVIGCIWKATLPHPYAYTALRVSLWALYTFFTGLFATGIWVIGHECGHQAFSESKAINNTVGFILHTAVGVPYHSWRVSHAKHHASTGHMTQDQVFVPSTRSELGLPPLKEGQEDLPRLPRSANLVKKELYEALGDSPIGAMYGSAIYLLGGWPAYILWNASGQKRYPKGTNHFNPNSPIYQAHHYNQVLVSAAGIVAWISFLGAAIHHWGFSTVLVTYLLPYLWVNHWLVLITFLQHTDPILPHYRAAEFTFPRGALATLDRNLLGDCGPHHGLARWEASAALKKKIAGYGLPHEGRPGGWAEVYRVYKQCKFVEDEGDVVFYKNAEGIAVMRPGYADASASDSGVEVTK
ncbi:fatty acid desaturase [Ephemerocybe angulata]|uniref:Fatty acid desaturase n=1 Tax=Ephemerocybe angulata TaxID=980116 RepID=A0A8H6I2G7_9AGAR|nr:fatty acid desaturase [Tulosesus angulatus]